MQMNRIAIVGTSGSGKTTLGVALAKHLGAAHVEIDSLYWEPGWTPTTTSTLRERVAAAITGDRWTIDGNYAAVRALIFDRADTIIWLDYPLTVVFTRVFCRTFRRWWKNQVLWNGNRERLFAQFFQRDSLLLWVLTTWRRRRRDYPKMLRTEAGKGKRIVRLRTPTEADRWLERVTSA